MSLIQGVGDEVVQFVAVVLIVAVAALAWWSTNARPDRYRTVLVMRSRTIHPVTLSIRSRSSLMLPPTATNNSIPATTTETASASTVEPVEDNNTRMIPLQEMDSIVDADMAMMDNNRLHFYRRVDGSSNVQTTAESTSDDSDTHEGVEPASNAQIREMDSIVSAMEADDTTPCTCFTRASESDTPSVIPTTVKNDNNNDTSAPSTAERDKQPETVTATAPEATQPEVAAEPTTTMHTEDGQRILIKLKYLNDTLKEVEGSLDELLKDFKWRHFSSELTAECRVRLIFNGRVLIDDGATLRACGLHHRAVVHCLVHPKRPAIQNHGITSEEINALPELLNERGQPDRSWDLENILMTLVSVALTVVWFFRCEYSNMFTASASVALFGLTVFYSVAIFGLYLSDSFHFDRRPAAAAAATPPQHVPEN